MAKPGPSDMLPVAWALARAGLLLLPAPARSLLRTSPMYMLSGWTLGAVCEHVQLPTACTTVGAGTWYLVLSAGPRLKARLLRTGNQVPRDWRQMSQTCRFPCNYLSYQMCKSYG